MTRRRAAKRLAKELWPEIICAALLILIGMAGQKDDPLFAGFVVVMLGIGEAMGLRHRRLPLQATLDGVRQDVSEVREIITTAVAVTDSVPDEPVSRGLRLVR